MWTSASTLAPGARLSQARIGSTHAVAATGATMLLRHRQQQTRNFGFGWWTTHFDREEQRQMRRRYKALRNKYSDALNRKLLWEQQSSEVPRSYRRNANHYWQSKRSFAFSGHRSSKGSSFKSPEDQTCAHPSHNKEAIDRSTWGSFLFRDSEGKQDSWAAAFDDMRNYVSKRQSDFAGTTGFGSAPKMSFSMSAASSSKSSNAFEPESDFVIDPITNRKISKVSAKSAPDESVTIPSASAKVPGSILTTPEPPQAAPTLDADLPPTTEELHAYKNVAVDTDSSLAANHTEQQKYEDLHEYKPVKYNEPDGKPTEPPVELGHEGYDPEEVQKYQPVQYNEPDGKPAVSNTDVPCPEELAKYQPFHWNEPDGQPTTPPVEIGHHGYDPAEVQQYQPFMWNEPHGQPDQHIELGHHSYDQAEVQQYGAFRYNEPDGKPPVFTGELGHHGYDQAEVQQYQAFRYNEPDGKPPVFTGELGHHGYDQTEVQQYQAFRYNEPDGKPPVFTGELGHHGYDQAEVQQYQAFRHNEPDGKPPVFTGELGHHGYDQAEVQQYRAFRHNEPDGKPEIAADSSAESLKEYDADSLAAETSDEAYSKVLRKLETLTTAIDAEQTGSGSAGAKQATATSATSDRSALESSMSRINSEYDTIDKLASISIKSSKSRAQKQLTYAERIQAYADPYSTEPQGLETAYAEECQGVATWPTYVKIHRRADRPGLFDATDPAAPQSVAPPAVYKILAYDPTMQSISIAETTSTVHDTASPLTPGEALLRLSNPTKFFPHFEPLRSQGFEIVSGSGDVLVFRKVHEPMVAEAALASSTSEGETLSQSPSVVNPTDMAAKPSVPPSTTNSLSPTGYVNLDLPSLHDNSPPTTNSPSPSPTPAQLKAERRFQSNIDVRREEPVFSGPKDSRSRKMTAAANNGKPTIAKRMVIGATWVAGISYALGVASEYIKGP